METQNKQENLPSQQKQLSEAEILVARKQQVGKLLTSENNIKKISASLPKGLIATKVIQVFMNSCTRNPKLLECTPNSILAAVLVCAQFGLMPDGITGECYIIPYKIRRKIKGVPFNQLPQVYEAQFLLGYKGMIQLAMRSGRVKRFQARAVRKGDIFEYELGTSEFIKHKPMGKSEQITHFYAILDFINGGQVFDVMTSDEVNFYRDKSPNYQTAERKEDTIWGQYYDTMGMKTVIRRLSKYSPVSSELSNAIALDEMVELGKSQSNQVNLLEYDDITVQDEVSMIEDNLNEVTGNDERTEEQKKEETKDKKALTSKEKADKLIKQASDSIK
jgi:recombination protein RecT